ncbi:MAG TPA: DHHA1 domain-containing protein, partial [Leptospiraceae bacterium]|nr:DHHA1 domain-containing protein [Leptospiraceae bacterium]
EQDAVALEKAAREYSKLSRKTQGGATLSAEEVELEKLGDLEFCARTFEGVSPENVKQLGDSLKEKHRKFCGLFGLKTDKGPVLIFMANRGAVEAGVDCGKLIREASGLIGGGGGGKPEMAQAGGKDASGLESAVQRAKGLLKESLHS